MTRGPDQEELAETVGDELDRMGAPYYAGVLPIDCPCRTRGVCAGEAAMLDIAIDLIRSLLKSTP